MLDVFFVCLFFLSGRNEMINYGKISIDSKKAARIDLSCDTNPQMIFVPSQGNVLVSN